MLPCFCLFLIFQQSLSGQGVADLLETNMETGIAGDDVEVAKRRNAFGSNTYPVKKGRTYLVYYCLEGFFFGSKCFLHLALRILIILLCVLIQQRFVWEAMQDMTLVILMIAATTSLALGIKTEVGFVI